MNKQRIAKCSCKWSDQSQCPDSAGDGVPNETKDLNKMSNCWAKLESCKYQRYLKP